MNTVSEIAEVFRKIQSAVIFTHTRPDGDAIGSALALNRAFLLLGKRSKVIIDGEIPAKFGYLEDVKGILPPPAPKADCYVSVDASDVTRLGDAQRSFLMGAKRGAVTVNIDHHISNTNFCKYNYVEENSSNCENIAAILREMKVPCEGEVATALMTGLVTDSGGFTHSDVGGNAFRTAALLSDGGANVNKITYETFRRQSKARAMMYLEILSHLRFFHDDRLAVAIVSASTLEKYALKQDATEGIVDFALTIDSVEVSVCILEVKEGQYKASFRSKGKVNVNEVAAVYGGGGHILASGCMFFGEIEEILDRLSYVVLQRLGDV